MIARKQVDLDIELKYQNTYESLPEPELAVRKIMFFTKFNETLDSLSKHPKIAGVVEELLGEPTDMIQDMALLKPPGGGREKPWHQDLAYFRYSPPEKVIGCWIALDTATVANGCMRVVPGTHLEGPIVHRHTELDCQIPDEFMALDRVVNVPLAPGGMLVFSALLHHGTADNNSPTRRRALQFHYAAKSCKKITVEQHAEMFHEEGHYAGCTVWPREEVLKVKVQA